MKNDSPDTVREPIVDGLFYPDSAPDLRREIEQFESSSTVPRGKAFAVVCPHAAYEKTGALMAAAYLAAADREIRRIVIIGPVHRENSDEIILPESRGFRTPLGIAEVDMKSVETVLSCSTSIIQNDIPHLEEHCLEVQLPFLQYHFPDAAIVPILLGRDTAANIRTLGKALFVAFGEHYPSTLFVVSANFSGNRETAAAAAEADEIIGLAERRDWKALVQGKVSRRFEACGAGCLASVLSLPGAGGVRLLQRASTVSDADRHKSVEYAALAVES